MFRAVFMLAAAALAITAVTGDALAKGNKKGFAIFDNNGEKIFDDGKLDGKGCVVGKQAVFDKATGGIKVVNAAKCNF